MNKKVIAGIVILFLALVLVFILRVNNQDNRISNIPNAENVYEGESNLESIPAISVFVQNLEVPWAIAFLPNGNLLVTERPGRLNIIENGKVINIAEIDVLSTSESGLHGVAVDPNFSDNNFIYLYYTYRADDNNTLNKVVRYRLLGNDLSDEFTIVDQIPGAPNHDGGRIKFGPDGMLYITTGDAQSPSRAQDRESLAGKILRVTNEGNPAPNNPFGTLIYSYGHRNPQGITWDNNNNLWSTEHGRSGAQSGLDELNLIEPGKNYGWPDIEGDEVRDGMETPILNSGATTTWAPAGAAFVPASPSQGGNGSIFFVGLRGQALYEYNIESRSISEHLKENLGRLREVVLGPDGLLYITTSNRDGRGNPEAEDDRILRINPHKLSEL